MEGVFWPYCFLDVYCVLRKLFVFTGMPEVTDTNLKNKLSCKTSNKTKIRHITYSYIANRGDDFKYTKPIKKPCRTGRRVMRGIIGYDNSPLSDFHCELTLPHVFHCLTCQDSSMARHPNHGPWFFCCCILSKAHTCVKIF